MFKRILVAVDGSVTALDALDKALELQQLTKQQDGEAEVLLLCVYKHHSLFEASLSMVRPNEMQIPDQALTEYAREVVDQAKKHALRQGITCRGFVKGGRPSKTIVNYAKKKEVDLIVMGSKGTHTDVDGMFLGSVSQRVAAHAKCPVMIV